MITSGVQSAGHWISNGNTVKDSLHEKNIKIFDFLKNGSNGFDYILGINSSLWASPGESVQFFKKQTKNCDHYIRRPRGASG